MLSLIGLIGVHHAYAADGHFWPESYYLGTLQARQALFEAGVYVYFKDFSIDSSSTQVLENSVRRWELTLPQAIEIVKRAFFDNANRIYNLKLEPRIVQM